MKADELLDLVQELVRTYQWTFTKSARDGMRGHGIKSSDVRDLLLGARSCDYQEESESWVVTGEAFGSAEHARVVFRVENAAQVVIISAHHILERGL